MTERYASIEKTLSAHPDCTHVMQQTETNRSTFFVNFAPAYLRGGRYLGNRIPGLEEPCYKTEDGWAVAYVNQQQPTTEQRVTAARFDTAAGRIPAHEFLEKGVGHMKDRASQRDAEDGERSMKRCVEAFNALEGTSLTETQGWKFMVMLKMARSVSGDFTSDDYEDMAAYAGLAGESASMENQNSDN